MKKSLSYRLGGAFLFAAILSFAPLASAETVITESVGTISDFSPDALVIRSETATAPTRYVVSKEVTYVDDAGAPVSMELVKSGLPVTVHYVKEGDRMIARKVVVRRSTGTTSDASVKSSTTVVKPAPVLEERSSTTTTTTTSGK